MSAKGCQQRTNELYLDRNWEALNDEIQTWENKGLKMIDSVIQLYSQKK